MLQVRSHRSFEYTQCTFPGTREVFFHSAYILRRSAIYDFGGNVCPSAVKLLRPSGRLLCSTSREQLISHSTLRVIDDVSYCIVLQFARLQYQGLIDLLMECYLRWHCTLWQLLVRVVSTPHSTVHFLSWNSIFLCHWKDVSHKYTVHWFHPIPFGLKNLKVQFQNRSQTGIQVQPPNPMLIALHSAAAHVLYLNDAAKVIDSLEIVLWRRTTNEPSWVRLILCGAVSVFNQTRQADWSIMRLPMSSVSSLQIFSDDVFGGSSQLGKHPERSGNHNRMEICLDCAGSKSADEFFFYHNTPRHPLIDHFVGGSPDIEGLSQVIITTESKSVCLGLRSFETCQW